MWLGTVLGTRLLKQFHDKAGGAEETRVHSD